MDHNGHREIFVLKILLGCKYGFDIQRNEWLYGAKNCRKKNLSSLLMNFWKIFQYKMTQQQQNAPKRLASKTMNSLALFPWLLWTLNQALIMFFFIGTYHKLAFFSPWEFSKEIPQNQNLILPLCKLLSQRWG